LKSRFDRRIVRLPIVGALVLALWAGGCGRKTGLDPPPATAVSDKRDPAQRDAGGIDEEGRPVAPPGKRKAIFLDWLID
jgi:hypothetical protein